MDIEMKKIFLVVRWPVGGIRTFINYIYGKWNYEPIELHILVPKVNEIAVLQEQLKNLPCVWHITASERPTFYDFMKEGISIIRNNQFSIIHAHGFTSAIAISPILPFSKAGKIFTSHDVLNEKQFAGIKGGVKKWLMSVALNRYDIIHSVSNDAEANLQENLPGVNSKKCVVVHNGVDTERFYTAEPYALGSQLGYGDDVVIIGFFGRFMSQKGFKYLIEAIQLLESKDPGKYRVVCFGAGAFIREEKETIARLGLESAFHFHDFVSDTAPYVKACDIVAMPSLWEAYSLVAMEVLAAGVPLVASSCIGLREACEGSPAIMVNPADSSSLMLGIEQAAQISPVTFSDYSEIAKIRFSVEKNREEIKKLYIDLAG